MNDHPTTHVKPILRVGFFILFLLLGLFIFVVFSHMRPMLPEPYDLPGRITLILGFLVLSLWARRSPRWEPYGQILFACFIAAAATAVDYYLPSRDWLLKAFNLSLDTPAGIAIDKLDSSIIIVFSVILLTKASGSNLSSIYLKRGNLKLGLGIGAIAFLVFAVSSIPVSEIFFGGRDLELARIVPWLPWILIFIVGNAFNEELLFRGLFLKKFGPFLGRFLSNLVIAIPFGLHHSGVSYSSDMLVFLALLIPLSLAWGFIMQKTDSLWGSVLFHAGADIPVVLSLFSALH
ncbi:MAG TPA: CPBP family intramembrane metalloprotease [Anaerolineae bacterium]|nr:CPBP family intramembrane metalloprotease [Anaerolineae bacterium]